MDVSKLDKTSVKNAYTTSSTDTYSCDYFNNNSSSYNITTGQSVKTNYKSDGNDVYVLRVAFSSGPGANATVNVDTGLVNKTVEKIEGVVGTSSTIPVIVPDAYTRLRYRKDSGRIYFDNASNESYASAGYLDVYYH